MGLIGDRSLCAIALIASISACGGNAPNDPGVSAADNGGSSSGSSSGGIGSTSSSGMASGGSGSSGGSGPTADAGVQLGSPGVTVSNAEASDPEIAYAVTLTTDSFEVGASQEVFMCQDFANPFQGQQADIKTYDLRMAPGSHHMLAFYKVGASDSSVVPCPQGGLQFGPFTFGAQAPNVTQTYPEGIGATIPTDTGFTLNMHYANAGATAVTGQVSLTMYVAKPGIITQHVGVLFLNQLSLEVPASATPSSPYTSNATYKLPQDINLLSAQSHMHQRGTNFVATTSSGQTIFQTTQWDEPRAATYSPPLALGAGTSISWSCSYVNDTGSTLTFGESALTNVMCILLSNYYPVRDIKQPVIAFQQ